MDTSEQLVSYAAMKYPHASVTYTVGDVTSDNFPFKWTSFDKIFAIHVLQCVKDYRGGLARFFDFLRPGGQLGVTYATQLFTDFLDREFSHDEKWKNYFEDLPEESERSESFQHAFHTCLDSLGFEVKKIKTEPMEYTFPSLEKAVVYYIGTSPYVKGIPAELRDPFEEDCLEKMTTEFNISQISDPFHATYDCLVVVAIKPPAEEEKHEKSGGKLKSLRSRLSLP
ncbi:juvenile hormone acid O-methyltransferase isoform X2 [Folsomia candida]|uniref:juvenile hormone acid O-methyltransferase isoform X2 n=1 Tax=Folsomia candida TaxID=158441 RepID=UPI00160500AB|nr:juvenile hormone acid O-methyltransferase isoform X2 [Folsomia candida]